MSSTSSQLRKEGQTFGVEMAAAVVVQERDCVNDCPCFLVRTFGSQCIEYVGDGDDAAIQWDVPAFSLG